MRPTIPSSTLSTSYRAIYRRFYSYSPRLYRAPESPHFPSIAPQSKLILRIPLPQTELPLQHTQTRTMASSAIPDRYKLVFFVPHSHLNVCKDAVFDVGAGTFPGGQYTKVCFQTPGQGQFMPNGGANPAIGAVGALEYVEEMKVEVMCLGRTIMLHAVEALKKAHPYEEVAYEVYKMENV
ncbi:GTP cyclohydrolase 1 type 2/Nif3, partial [Aspergillus floccosus]